MNLSNSLIALNLMAEAFRQGLDISQRLIAAHTEGRGLSKEELGEIVTARKTAISQLDAEIARQEGK